MIESPPHDTQSEKDILSSALLNETALLKLMECDENIFYFIDNRKIFNAITELFNADEKVDMSSVRTFLNGSVKEDYLISLSLCPTIHGIDYLISDLEKKSYQRELMSLSKDLYNSVISGDVCFKDFINRIIEINDKMNEPKQSECITVSELSEIDFDELYKSGNYLETGILGLDEKILGLFKGQLVVVAAPPGLGKSTLALQIACNINDSVYISLEMSREELYAKILSRYSEVNSQKIEGKKCDSSEVGRLLRAREEIKKEIRLTLFDSSISFFKLISRIKKICKSGNVKTIIIDYLQLVDGAPGANQEEKISKITRTLKLLAFSLKIPVVLLSQLTKDVLKEGRAPTLGDLRGSGAIGQDADVVIFLYDDKDNSHSISIGKCRKGQTGKLRGIEFEKKYSRFKNIETRYADMEWTQL